VAECERLKEENLEAWKAKVRRDMLMAPKVDAPPAAGRDDPRGPGIGTMQAGA
jgi:hypothetical protein